jgi:hypothetical protein
LLLKTPPRAEEEAVDAVGNPASPWWQKVLRVFFFAFFGALLTGLLPIADQIANGMRVDFDVLGSLLLGLAAGGIAAGIRAVVALLPVFVDDNVGLQR